MRDPIERNEGDFKMPEGGQQVSVNVRPALAIGIEAVQRELLCTTARGRLARQIELLLTGFAEGEAGLMKGAAADIVGELVLYGLEQPAGRR